MIDNTHVVAHTCNPNAQGVGEWLRAKDTWDYRMNSGPICAEWTLRMWLRERALA